MLYKHSLLNNNGFPFYSVPVRPYKYTPFLAVKPILSPNGVRLIHVVSRCVFVILLKFPYARKVNTKIQMVIVTYNSGNKLFRR